ncbi:Mg-protoporphyrin IX methyl transferase [compost metagenome]
MEKFSSKNHWENIYATKQLNEVSWYQPKPETSLEFLEKLKLPKTARIIDIGGGDSFFAESLLDMGYTDISVLDISEGSLERAKKRLGEKSKKIKWIVADVTLFNQHSQYDFWHDRAAFHFLHSPQEISDYINNANAALANDGVMVVGTFSENGPKKCSGIEITQYSKEALSQQFENYFEKIGCINVNHVTPFNTVQNFTFCSFNKKQKRSI